MTTEADGTKVIDLQAWRRDAYGAFVRGETDRPTYEKGVAAIQGRIDAMTAK